MSQGCSERVYPGDGSGRLLCAKHYAQPILMTGLEAGAISFVLQKRTPKLRKMKQVSKAEQAELRLSYIKSGAL